ncbi:MAG: hypothetical protein BWX80_04120 [Candidatus Hydrogenedentes bacterium ADurb.Bin101]|nr:MAG: hypothetical protein BWX80_04120 [Candidatus Hydrogenedentes bacterium ADurb.Bin101]
MIQGLGIVRLLACVNNRLQVRFNGKPTLIPPMQQVADDILYIPVAIAAHAVMVFAVNLPGVFDVYIHNIRQYPLVVLPAVLAIGYRVTRVVNHLQGGTAHFAQQNGAVFGGKAAPTAAILMDQDHTAVFRHMGEVFHALDGLPAPVRLVHRMLRVVGITHHADERGAKPMHARNGAQQVGFVQLKIACDGPRPVGDCTGKTGHPQVRLGNRSIYRFKIPVGDCGNIDAVDNAQFHIFPTQFLVGPDLGRYILPRFVGNA